MNLLPVHSVKDACRFVLQTAGSLWLVVGNPATWGAPYSDSAPPDETQVSTILSPICAIPAQAQWVIEMLSIDLTVGGTAHTGDVLNLTFTSSSLTGSPITRSYTMGSLDTLTDGATGLAAAINSDSVLTNAGILTSSIGSVITVAVPKSLSVTFSESVTGSGATTTLTLVTGDSGDYTLYDSNNSPRYFNRVLTEAAAIADMTSQLILLASIPGSALLTLGANSYRQIGFATDLIPAAGHSTDNPLAAANVSSYGDLEMLENNRPVTVIGSELYNYGYILQY